MSSSITTSRSRSGGACRRASASPARRAFVGFSSGLTTLAILTACGTASVLVDEDDTTAARAATSAEVAAERSGVAESSITSDAVDPVESSSVTEGGPTPENSDISDVVGVEAQDVLEEVEWTDEVEVENTVVVQISDVTELTADAEGPGDIGGPAVGVTVQLANETKQPVDLSGVTVTAQDDDGSPLSMLDVDPAKPLTETLAPSAVVDGVYVFSFPEGSPAPVSFTVNYAPEAPVAVFVGALS